MKRMFNALTVLIVVLTGMVAGQLAYDVLWGPEVTIDPYGGYHSKAIILSGYDKALHLIIYWGLGPAGKGFCALFTLWLFCGSLLRKIAWKWTILIAGIWSIFFGVVGPSMHALS